MGVLGFFGSRQCGQSHGLSTPASASSASPWAPPQDAHIGRFLFVKICCVPRHCSRLTSHQSLKLPERNPHSDCGSARRKSSLKSPRLISCACSSSQPEHDLANGMNSCPCVG